MTCLYWHQYGFLDALQLYTEKKYPSYVLWKKVYVFIELTYKMFTRYKYNYPNIYRYNISKISGMTVLLGYVILRQDYIS